MQKKRWSDLSLTQKCAIVTGGTIQVGLLALGLWDLAHRRADEVRGDRRLWAGLMFIDWFGPIAYFAYGRKDSPLRGLWSCREEESEAAEESDDTEENQGFAGPVVV